jgi:hypothetical protein
MAPKPHHIALSYDLSQGVALNRNHDFFDVGISIKKSPIWFFCPLSNLTNVPFWTNHLSPNHFD